MNASSQSDAKLELFRHTLATLAYRAGKVLRQAPAAFADFHAGEGLHTPAEILAHMGDLLDWALSIVRGAQVWRNSKPLPWEQEVGRFFSVLKALDDFLALGSPAEVSLEKLFQGPVADAMTHVGQLALLRRLAGSPVKSENFYKAEMVAGRVGAEQAVPKLEF